MLSPDGTLLWERDLGDSSYATPYVDAAGNVYAGSDADVFFSFDRDGKERFRVATNGDLDTGIVEGPDGTLAFAAGRELWSVRSDGTVRFRFRANGKIFTTPAIADDGTIYVGSQDDRLLAVAPDGRLRFSFGTRGDVDGSPAIADDGSVVFGSDDRHVYCVESDGRARWSVDLGGMIRAPAAFARDGTIYVSVFGPRTRLVALSPIDGSSRWEFELGRADSSDVGVASGVLVDRDGNLYVGAHDDFVYSLTPGGALRFAHATRGRRRCVSDLGAGRDVARRWTGRRAARVALTKLSKRPAVRYGFLPGQSFENRADDFDGSAEVVGFDASAFPPRERISWRRISRAAST